ncbi:MAG: cation transporter, partial [Deltaproteobacteria bacterium]|nr:cation transporter [Deltaproteobacteria bacterium]
MDGKPVEKILYDLEPKGPVQPEEVPITRVCWIAFWANLGLALLKITVGALGYSRLLIIDGLNSAANAMMITNILFGIQMGISQRPTEKYPYGKGKARYIGALLIGFFLGVGAAVILAISVKTFFMPVSFESTGIGLATALVSIGGNLMVIRFLRQTDLHHSKEVAKRIAYLHALNITSSGVVAQGLLVGGIFGWFIPERIGSLTISLIVLFLSIRITKSALDGIMDRSAGREMESRIATLANSVDKVEDVRWVRTRNVGHNLWIDLQVALKGECSIRRADQASEQIRER